MLYAKLDSTGDFALLACYFLSILILIYAVFDLVRIFRDSLIFHPDSPPHSRACVATPDIFCLLFEEHFVPAKDGVKLHFFFVHHG